MHVRGGSTKVKQARYLPLQGFAWDANAGGDNVLYYSLYYGTSTGNYNGAGSPVNLGNVTSYRFSIVPAGNRYFALTATNSVGESAKSTEIHY